MSDPDEQGESPDGSATESGDEGPPEGAEAPPEGAAPEAGSDDGDEQPAIESDEQAVVPSDIDPDDVEAEAGADDGSDDDTDAETAAEPTEPESMAEAGPDPSVAKAGEMYVSVVRSVTNAQIRKHGGENELGRDHFEQYDLAHHFNETMDMMGVGSDLEPHEALLFATVLSMGDGLTRETDVLDKQIDRLMDKALGGDGGEAAA
ncbi:hypothetical protein [Halobaculum sp. EA56]|uniref:hypothetical protein n=1 Tax=Halobaculum sp. EA56 TaxID=3421648 RepID=UPI003EC0EA3C